MRAYVAGVPAGDHPYAEEEALGTLQSVYRDEPRARARSEFQPSDYGNAERLHQRHGAGVRYSPKLGGGGFLIYDGTRWAPDETGATMRYAKDTVRAMYTEAESIEDADRRTSFVKFVIRQEQRSRLEAMVALLQSEPGIAIRVEELDADPWLLNCQNGTLDLRTQVLRRHRREDLITKLVPTTYDPTAACPRFLEFLQTIMAGDEQMIAFLQRAVGYSLTGDTSERCLFILHGSGANGKTIFLQTLAMLLNDLAMRTPTSTLLAKRSEGVPNDIARLRGARFVGSVPGRYRWRIRGAAAVLLRSRSQSGEA